MDTTCAVWASARFVTHSSTQSKGEKPIPLFNLSLSPVHVLLMHCSLCVLYPPQLKGTLKNLPYYYYKLIIFISLSLSWLVPILLSATSEAWGNQHITEKAQPLVTSIIPLCCVVPDTVNDNQWTNNNLAGLIMRTMLTQQLVIHWSICQYCTVEQGVVLSSWKRNNSVYYNINIKSGFIQNPKLIQREEIFTIFQ